MSVYTHDGGHGPLVVGDALHGVIDAEIEVEDAFGCGQPVVGVLGVGLVLNINVERAVGVLYEIAAVGNVVAVEFVVVEEVVGTIVILQKPKGLVSGQLSGAIWRR